MPKLRNTLIDACVVIGVDSNTELCHTSGGPELGDENHLRYGPYKQHVLGVLTESLAYFPETTSQVEGMYKYQLKYRAQEKYVFLMSDIGFVT